MRTGRGRLMAVSAVLLGLTTFAGAGFVLKERIVAEYHLSRLNEDDIDEDHPRFLVRMGSLHGPATPNEPPGIEMVDWQEVEFYGRTAHAEALARMGERAVPLLIRELKNSDPKVRLCAVWALGQIGPSAAKAIPLLTQLRLRDGPLNWRAQPPRNRLVSLSAVEALKKIQGK